MVLSLDTCGLGLVSFGLGLGLGLEPSGFVNITAGRFGPASGRTDAFCATRSPTPGAAGRADSEYAECHNFCPFTELAKTLPVIIVHTICSFLEHRHTTAYRERKRAENYDK